MRFYVHVTTLAMLVSACGLKSETVKEPIGPNVNASLVIYFRSETTEEQSERVQNEILYIDRPDGRGKDIVHNIRTVLQLLPSQANGNEAVALTLKGSSKPVQKTPSFSFLVYI